MGNDFVVGSRPIPSDSVVLDNLERLNGYHASMGCALSKAHNGSIVEDSYYLEKIRRAARLFGYELVEPTDGIFKGPLY